MKRLAFAIIRVDDYLGPSIPAERRVTVKKIVFDPGEADREVGRLNSLKEAEGSRYFVHITRVEFVLSVSTSPLVD